MFDDNTIIKEFDLENMPSDIQNQALDQIKGTLQLRFGQTLAASMTDQQQEAFNAVLKKGDNQEITNWLIKEFPNYQEQIKQEFDRLKLEIQQDAKSWTGNS
jgi:hypothetical protein